MQWDDLRYLLAVARTGSLSAAARQLGVSHSTVYRRVKAFEEERGVRCFDRLADRYRLTEAGERLAAQAEEVEARVVEIERGLGRLEQAVEGQVVVAAPESVGLLLCPQLLRLTERHPGLTLAWRLDTQAVNLGKGEADIALRAAMSPPETLVGRRLASVAFAVYGARQYLERHPWTGPAGARWVVFDESHAALPQARWEREELGGAAVVMRVNRRVLLDEAVRAGLGVGILAVASGEQDPQLQRLTAPIDALTLPLWILTHEELREVPRVRAVMEFCAEVILAEKDLVEGRGLDAPDPTPRQK